MVKDINHITIRQFDLYEKTHKTRYLMYMPVGRLFARKLALVIAEIRQHLQGEDKQDEILAREYHKTKSVYRIQELTALYQATSNLLINKTLVNVWLASTGCEVKELKNLSYYIEQIEAKTGIKVTSLEDLEKLQRNIQRWVDKFEENFHEVKVQGLTFMQTVLGVFAVMNMNLNYNMYLSEFFELKRTAEDKAKRMNDAR